VIWTVKQKPLKYPRRKINPEQKQKIHELYDQYHDIYSQLLDQFKISHKELHESYEKAVKEIFNEQHSVSGGEQAVPEDKLLAGYGEDKGDS